MFFDGAGGLMNYRIWRPTVEVDAVLVFLHGLGQCSADYHRFGRAMNHRGIEVWGLDHAGHGLSEGEPDILPPLPQLVANAEIFLTMARAAHPNTPLLLAGHSLGAGVALLAMHAFEPAVRHVRGLALTGTPTRDIIMRLPPPAVPALLLHGTDDRIAPLAPVRAWASRSPGIEFHEFQNSGHDLLHEPVRREIHSRVAEFTARTVVNTMTVNAF
ncbi:alpha/beta hydrolase [Nocardia heshunensis]